MQEGGVRVPARTRRENGVILVTGATGRVGHRLMEALADADADATAMVRVEAKAADLPGAPRYVVATFDDPPPPEILQGFDRIFLLSPAQEEQAALEMVFIDAVATAGHRPHIVKVAADGFQDPDCEVRFMRSHRQVAMHLDALGLPVTYLAPSLYMENLLAAADTIRKEGTIAAPAGHGKVGFVAATDVAVVAARVLTSQGHDGAIYVVTGPEALGTRTSRRVSQPSSRGRWTTSTSRLSAHGNSCWPAAWITGKRTASSSCSSGSGTAAPTP